MISLSAAQQRWMDEEPLYAELAGVVKEILRREAWRRGVTCSVDARAKDTASLLKKLLLKKYEAWEQLTDKAGARITVTYIGQLPAARLLVEQTFDIISCNDPDARLGVDRVGYRGANYDVTVPDELLGADHEQLRGLVCEVQVSTTAQRLWADISHHLLYKPAQDVPGPVQRVINRLVALMEIFDDQVEQARRAIQEQPGFEDAHMLQALELHFFPLAARDYDRQLSLEILNILRPLLSGAELDEFGRDMSEFVASNQAKLIELFAEYAQDDRQNLLLFQPEALLVFRLLGDRSFQLRDVWEDALPEELLDDLEAIWGGTV
jgi:ppGpp synthetase/RelA/SpoT-type nucleotidyltranferase